MAFAVSNRKQECKLHYKPDRRRRSGKWRILSARTLYREWFRAVGSLLPKLRTYRIPEVSEGQDVRQNFRCLYAADARGDAEL